MTLFRSFSDAELLELKASAITRLIGGVNRVISTAQSGDVTSEKVWEIDPVLFWKDLTLELERRGLIATSSNSRRTTRTTFRYL